MSIGEKIQQLRKVSGLSQEQLAEMIGVSRQAISKWETDQSVPEVEKILVLSRVFSISTDELLGNNISINAEVSTPQLEEIAIINVKKRQFTLGWITLLLGLVMLICDFFMLKIIQYNDKQNLSYFYDDSHLLKYAEQQPMSTIIIITTVIIVIGIWLTISAKGRIFPAMNKPKMRDSSNP